MVPPLPEGPLSQLKLMLSPRHCADTKDRGGVIKINTAVIKPYKSNNHKTQKDHSFDLAQPQIYPT